MFWFEKLYNRDGLYGFVDIFLIGQLYPILKNISQVNRGKLFTDSYDSTIILIGYIKGHSRKYDKLGA